MSNFEFSAVSNRNLNTCEYRLVMLANAVLGYGLFDFGIIQGHRNEGKQNHHFNNKASRVQWPNSKHNSTPSKAFDFVLWLDGRPTTSKKDLPSYYMAIGVFKVEARRLGFDVRSGGDWDGDWSVTDQKFNDLMHIEILGE